MNKKTVWFDARKVENNNSIIPLVFNRNYEYIIVKEENYKEIKLPSNVKLVIELNSNANISTIPKEYILFTNSKNLACECKNLKRKVAYYKRIDDQLSMNAAYEEADICDYLIVDFKDETNIPLELILARLQAKNVSVLKVVSNLQDMKIAFAVMEHGSDGAVLNTNDLNEIVSVSEYMEKSEVKKLNLVKAKVTNAKHIGLGYRSCIDTTSIMNQKEGMLIGSTSRGGILVSSETHYLPYMNLRPFRVNAGAVHSYVWSADNMTNYLSEIKAGDNLLCVDVNGNARTVSVGRIKTEKRPLLLIEVTYENISINVIVQDDWHIRIMGGDGEPRNASTIKIGDELLAYICEPGRHVGVKINEEIEER